MSPTAVQGAITMTFKPMLASPADLQNIKYPVLVSPKLDGIRCLIIDGVACSRSLKAIPNKRIQKLFGKSEFNGLDGELIVGLPGDKDVFQRTTSGAMSVEGCPGVTFHVFDDFSIDGSFANRLQSAATRQSEVCGMKIVPHHCVETPAELGYAEEWYLSIGYEGLMLRHPDGPYKQGRATVKEGWLLKVKRKEEDKHT